MSYGRASILLPCPYHRDHGPPPASPSHPLVFDSNGNRVRRNVPRRYLVFPSGTKIWNCSLSTHFRDRICHWTLSFPPIPSFSPSCFSCFSPTMLLPLSFALINAGSRWFLVYGPMELSTGRDLVVSGEPFLLFLLTVCE